MKELSIFIDESGDFGDSRTHAPHYLIAAIFHDQSMPIRSDLLRLERYLRTIGLPPDFYVHVGPAIRREGGYRSMSLEARKKLVYRTFAFFRSVPVTYKTFWVEKKYADGPTKIAAMLRNQIKDFITENYSTLQKYNKVKIYYDGGQAEVARVLRATFKSALASVTIKNAAPADYRLSQVADLICSLKLIEVKLKNGKLTKSERFFFRSGTEFRKKFLIPMRKKEFGK